MPNHCYNILHVNGPVEELNRFKQYGLLDEEQILSFDKFISQPERIENFDCLNQYSQEAQIAIKILLTITLIKEPVDLTFIMSNISKLTEITSLHTVLSAAIYKSLCDTKNKEEAFTYWCREVRRHLNIYNLWTLKYWGTDRDCYWFNLTQEKWFDEKQTELRFFTAWNAALPVIQEMSKSFPSLVFDLWYGVEIVDSTYHYIRYQNGVRAIKPKDVPNLKPAIKAYLNDPASFYQQFQPEDHRVIYVGDNVMYEFVGDRVEPA